MIDDSPTKKFIKKIYWQVTYTFFYTPWKNAGKILFYQNILVTFPFYLKKKNHILCRDFDLKSWISNSFFTLFSLANTQLFSV